jgi:hypothetical protein
MSRANPPPTRISSGDVEATQAKGGEARGVTMLVSAPGDDGELIMYAASVRGGHFASGELVRAYARQTPAARKALPLLPHFPADPGTPRP